MDRGWAEKFVLRLASVIGKKEGVPPDVVSLGVRGMHALGWVHEETEEPAPPHVTSRTGKTTIRPWYVSPKGERVRGLKAAVLVAASSIPPEARAVEVSPLAARVVRALRLHPDVLAEVREVLNGARMVQADPE